MSKRRKANIQSQTPNFRSVGAKTYDFNRLKNTTLYKAFNRKSVPHLEKVQLTDNNKQQQNINLSIRLNVQKKQQQKIATRKKISIMVDKWKEKYNKGQQNYIKRKKFQNLPAISKLSQPLPFTTNHENFKLIKSQSQNKTKKTSFTPIKEIKKINLQQQQQIFQENSHQIFHKYEPQLKFSEQNKTQEAQSPNKNKKFNLELDIKAKKFIKTKRKQRQNYLTLKPVQQMFQRWQINLEDEWF